MIYVTDLKKILRVKRPGEFQFGDLVNVVGCRTNPGVVVKVDRERIFVLWEELDARNMFSTVIEHWFEPRELEHVV